MEVFRHDMGSSYNLVYRHKPPSARIFGVADSTLALALSPRKSD
jgi:hypothetical protein